MRKKRETGTRKLQKKKPEVDAQRGKLVEVPTSCECDPQGWACVGTKISILKGREICKSVPIYRKMSCELFQVVGWLRPECKHPNQRKKEKKTETDCGCLKKFEGRSAWRAVLSCRSRRLEATSTTWCRAEASFFSISATIVFILVLISRSSAWKWKTSASSGFSCITSSAVVNITFREPLSWCNWVKWRLSSLRRWTCLRASCGRSWITWATADALMALWRLAGHGRGGVRDEDRLVDMVALEISKNLLSGPLDQTATEVIAQWSFTPNKFSEPNDTWKYYLKKDSLNLHAIDVCQKKDHDFRRPLHKT